MVVTSVALAVAALSRGCGGVGSLGCAGAECGGSPPASGHRWSRALFAPLGSLVRLAAPDGGAGPPAGLRGGGARIGTSSFEPLL